MNEEESDNRASRRHYLGIVLAVYWVTMFIATHVPLPALPILAGDSDKVLHLVGYTGLGFLFGLWVAVRRRLTLPVFIVLLTILTLYGAADEWLQQFVNRFTDFQDWVADTIGAVIGLSLIAVQQLLRPTAVTTDESSE